MKGSYRIAITNRMVEYTPPALVTIDVGINIPVAGAPVIEMYSFML